MNRMLLLCAILIISTAVQGSADTIELLTLEYPPYEYLEKGKVKGIAVEIVREVFRRMEQPVRISLYPWQRALNTVRDGDADGLFTAYKTPEREKYADYSHEVLMPQIVSLFVLKDSRIRFDGDLSKLAGYSFGVARTISYGKVFDQALKNKVLTNIDVAPDGELNMKKLLKGRFDILVSNKYGAWDILRKTGKSDQVKELSPYVQNVPSYIAFSKKRGLTALREKFDKVLKEMKQTGVYEKIISRKVRGER